MKKLSLLTIVAALSCITLLVACGQNRNYRYGNYGYRGGHCSPQTFSRGYDRGYDYRYDRGYDSCRHVRPYRRGCDDGWHSGRFHRGGAHMCFEARWGMHHDPYWYTSVSSDQDQTEAILCDLNEQPETACPQGLTCQELEGDIGICS